MDDSDGYRETYKGHQDGGLRDSSLAPPSAAPLPHAPYLPGRLPSRVPAGPSPHRCFCLCRSCCRISLPHRRPRPPCWTPGPQDLAQMPPPPSLQKEKTIFSTPWLRIWSQRLEFKFWISRWLFRWVVSFLKWVSSVPVWTPQPHIIRCSQLFLDLSPPVDSEAWGQAGTVSPYFRDRGSAQCLVHILSSTGNFHINDYLTLLALLPHLKEGMTTDTRRDRRFSEWTAYMKWLCQSQVWSGYLVHNAHARSTSLTHKLFLGCSVSPPLNHGLGAYRAGPGLPWHTRAPLGSRSLLRDCCVGLFRLSRKTISYHCPSALLHSRGLPGVSTALCSCPVFSTANRRYLAPQPQRGGQTYQRHTLKGIPRGKWEWVAATYPQTPHLTSLCLNFPTCKMGLPMATMQADNASGGAQHRGRHRTEAREMADKQKNESVSKVGCSVW